MRLWEIETLFWKFPALPVAEEAKLWGQELLRMYKRFAQMKGFKVEHLDEDVLKLKDTVFLSF